MSTALWILGTMTTSTSLVMLNKYAMAHYQFNWPISLTTYHFYMTFFLLELMCRLKFFNRAEIPEKVKWIMGFNGVSAIVFMNFNLKMNSIGFYQLSKLACIPVMVAFNFTFFGKKTPFRTLCTLLVLLIGLALFTINDVQFNIKGCIMAIIAIITTTANQTYNGHIQGELKCGGPALQHQTALAQAILATFAALALEMWGENSILHHEYVGLELPVVLSTGLLAVCSNVCAFALIGKTSAVTYQVVGHAKTILVFVFGLIFFKQEDEPTDKFLKKIFGLVLSMVGTIVYTIFEMQDKAAAAANKNLEEQNQALLTKDTQKLRQIEIKEDAEVPLETMDEKQNA